MSAQKSEDPLAHLENTMIPFNPSLPDITKREPIRAYRIGDNLALLVKNPKSLAQSQGIGEGVIEYLYALAVITTEKDMVLMVTSERSGDVLRAMSQNTIGVEQTENPFICIFTESGTHLNLGNSPDWSNIDKFAERALKIACEYLKTDAVPIELQTKPGKASRLPRVGLPLWIILRKLDGWERLLVVVSGIWLIIATAAYFSVLGEVSSAPTFFSKLVPPSAFHWIADTNGIPNPFGDFPVIPVFNVVRFSAFLLIPILIANLLFLVVRWVSVGFKRQA